MGLHKLSAGDGYTYLTRQVAAGDSTERGYTSLGDYYTARGETPGVWIGGGAHVLGVAGGQVTEQQMINLFGHGIHPDAERVRADRYAHGATVPAATKATRLGARFPVFDGVPEWRVRLGERYQAWNQVRGLPGDWPIPPQERARMRTDTARDMFTETHHRDPASTQELDGFLRQVSRPRSVAVAGYDLTFTPVKSVSTLWAIAPPEVSRAIEDAHHAAVTATLAWLETQVAYTRVGHAGVAQVNTDGLTCAAFTHRDSRAGDPDLHTHVAVSNKVRVAGTADRWLALDGRMIHRYTVAGSEMYNTLLEAEITARTGAGFAERPGDDPGKRPVRELVGVAPALNARWSSRRTAITRHRETLVADFRTAHGRLPTPVEMLALAQQATLATRHAKHEPRTHADQRHTWFAQALDILGGPAALNRMLTAITPAAGRPQHSRAPLSPAEVANLAAATVAAVAETRALWSVHNLAAEAARQIRGHTATIHPRRFPELIARITHEATGPAYCVPIGPETDIDVTTPTPAALRRADGTTVYRIADAERYTSRAVIDAEQRLLTAARTGGARVVDRRHVDLAMIEWAANHGGATLNTSQAALVDQVATTDRQLMLALAPAGTGKTTAMGVLARVWTNTGGTVIGLAPQAAAAHTLAESIHTVGDTLDKLVYDLTTADAADRAAWRRLIGPDTLVIIDEAGLAATGKLDRAVRYITGRGGRVLLVGDDRQRAASGAGGLLRDIESDCGAISLTEVLRFTDPAEAQASLALRAGDPAAAAYYTDHGRLHPVAMDEAADAVYAGWAADIAAGIDSIMIAPTLEWVSELNDRAHADRIAATGHPDGPQVRLPNGETLAHADLIVTKRNDRRLSLGGTDFVRNNDRWTVQQVHPDGSITATLLRRRVTRRLPAAYLAAGHVRLGYATTAASVQGLTVGQPGRRPGTAHVLITATMTRNDAYPALTRATDGTHIYVISTRDGDTHDVSRPESVQPSTAAETLADIITTDGSAVSVTTAIRHTHDPTTRLGAAAAAYTHAAGTAAETRYGATRLAALHAAAEHTVPGITDAPCWDVLRSHLINRALAGSDPAADLAAAATGRELATANDPAAVLDWRLDPTGRRACPHGPLPWLPGAPPAVDADPAWHTYLADRAHLVTHLAETLRDNAATWTPADAPAWAVPYLPDRPLLADLAEWRAAHAVPDTDPRPAGPRPPTGAEAERHRHLTARALATAGDPTAGPSRWAATLSTRHAAHITDDDYWPVLAARLTLAENAGLPVTAMLDQATHQRPLPAEQPAAALWWRLAPHLGDLTPAHHNSVRLRPPWTRHLTLAVGPHLADTITADPLWPVIIAKLDAAQRNGADPATIAADAAALLAAHAATLAPHQAAPILLWTITTLTDPHPPDPAAEPPTPDPADADIEPPSDLQHPAQPPDPPTGHIEPPIPDEPADPDHTPPDPTDRDRRPPPDDADRPVTRERILETLAAAHAYYTDQAPDSWVPDYLTRRGLPTNAAGYAPAGWTALTEHLRALGFIDQELQAAGLAKTSSRGTLIDVFRDRAVLPIHTPDGHIAAFIGRKPETNHDDRTPKYLNSPGTDVYTKALLPYGLTPETVAALRRGADLAITEGPMDALAINAAATARALNLVAIAPNGTALTPGQLHTLGGIADLADRTVIIAMDNDLAGRTAAARAYPLLLAAGVTNPQTVPDWHGKDAAQTLTEHGAGHLADLLTDTQPLADQVIDQILSRWPTHDGTPETRTQALNEAAPAVAAMPAAQRTRQTARLADALHYDSDLVQRVIAHHRPPPDLQLPTPPTLSPQTQAVLHEAHLRDATLAAVRASHPALTADPYWPHLAETLHRAIELDYHATTRLPQLADQHPLDARHPAQDLEFRLLQDFPDCYQPPRRTTTSPSGNTAAPGPPGIGPTITDPRPAVAPRAPAPRR